MTATQGVEYTITYLSMQAPPSRPAPPRPSTSRPLALMRAYDPPAHFFLYLYRAVGEAYDWTDMTRLPSDELEAFVKDPKVELCVLYGGGAPAGFYQLDFRKPETCDLAFFGLTPEWVGRGVGPWLLRAAIDEAWGRGIESLTVNTCTLDHPSALATYQRAGFSPVRQEKRRRPT